VTLMSLCAMCTSLLVSAGVVSCYRNNNNNKADLYTDRASVVNLIWFADEKCLLCQHWATWGHEIKCLAIQ